MGTVLLVLIVALIVWAIATYNGLVTGRNQVENGWKQIGVQLKRRHDLIPNLVETVKGAMQFERETLEKVVAARARAVAATTVPERSQAENELTRSLGRLLAVIENYPELKANQNVLQLQEELTTTENQIGFARQFYNDVVMRFNTRLDVFPSNVIANFFAFQRAEFFAADDADKAVPRVDLSLKS
ncbi:MAG TPA: LemA family protein [Candidatus Binatia bacterium]|nr:LemA family protein [Candidatus Binatia bacterium]